MATAAFFDLDRTLLPGGSGRVFGATLARLGVETPSVPGQDLLFKFFDVFGESFVIMQLARLAAGKTRGLDRAMVQASAEIAADELLEMVQPYARDVLAQHRALGDRLVLATTSPFDLVSPFARRLGFDAVVATRYVEHEGLYTGELDGGFVWGPGKRKAVAAWAKSQGMDLADCAAYSDSFFDAPMLNAVGRPVAVNPDARLRVLALARRWPIRSLDAPEGVPSINGVEPFDVLRNVLRPELLPFAKFVFEGMSNIPTSGPAIVVANHRSYFDPLAIALAVGQAGRNGRFLGKKEVFDAPVVGNFARSLGSIRVDRGTGSDQPLHEAASALNAGEVVVILPQGTIPRGEAFFDPILKGRLGVARLAAMCPDVPVIPLGVWGTEAVWPRKSKVPMVWNVTNPPKVLLRAGEPVSFRRRATSKASLVGDLDVIMTAIMDLLPAESREKRSVSVEELAATVPGGDLTKVRRSGPRADSDDMSPSPVTARTASGSPKKTAPSKTKAAKKPAKKKTSTKNVSGKKTATKAASAKKTASKKPKPTSTKPAAAATAPSRRLPGSLSGRPNSLPIR